jgi:hypothetical protein
MREIRAIRFDKRGGKRTGAAWSKLPRPFSSLPQGKSARSGLMHCSKAKSWIPSARAHRRSNEVPHREHAGSLSIAAAS